MRIRSNNGFTLIELLVALTVLAVFIAVTMPFFTTSRDKVREDESIANLHEIRVALERYSVDTNGQYPMMIWGGDRKGWSTKEGVGCRTMWEHEEFNGKNEDKARPPLDPLIRFGYLSSYPANPFLNARSALRSTISWTGPANCKPGDGDVRFGFDGTCMGNIMEDPRYLWNSPNKLSRIKNTFCEGASKSGMSMISDYPANPFYSMGGLPEWPQADNLASLKEKVAKQPTNPEYTRRISAYWPGQFFYRSAGTFLFPETYLFGGDTKDKDELRKIWGIKYTRIDTYFIGVFGSLRTDGLDIIRLTDINGVPLDNRTGYLKESFYNKHPSFKYQRNNPIYFSPPEVLGGGNFGIMPYFPYLDPSEDGFSFLYGAPDGYRDGVIAAYTGEEDGFGVSWDKKNGMKKENDPVTVDK